jgi:hypothetical protein
MNYIKLINKIKPVSSLFNEAPVTHDCIASYDWMIMNAMDRMLKERVISVLSWHVSGNQENHTNPNQVIGV